MQIYFLVIVTNILAGLVLSRSFLEEKISGFAPFSGVLRKDRFKLILGIVTVLTALFTLLVKVTPADVVVLGNLLPALSGALMGAYLILSSFYKDLEEERSWMKSFVDLVESRGYIIGFAGMLIGTVHFLVPSALIL